MSLEYHIDQKVVCICEFPNKIQGRVIVKPLKINAVYTVLLPIKNTQNLDNGIMIKGHEKLQDTIELAVYDDTGFMPLDLWIKNSKAVDELMKEIL